MIAAGEATLILQEERAAAEVDLGALVESYGPLLFRVAHAILRSPHDAEDAVQDTFVRVLQHRKALPEIRDLRVWLVRIAWNVSLDRRRRIRPDQMDELFAGTLAAQLVPADRALDEAGRLKLLLAEIEGLPKLERQVLLLSAVEELSTAEVAGVLGKSDSATRALLFRARSRLKERMEKAERKKGGQR